jgi:hypothetical protein
MREAWAAKMLSGVRSTVTDVTTIGMLVSAILCVAAGHQKQFIQVTVVLWFIIVSYIFRRYAVRVCYSDVASSMAENWSPAQAQLWKEINQTGHWYRGWWDTINAYIDANARRTFYRSDVPQADRDYSDEVKAEDLAGVADFVNWHWSIEQEVLGLSEGRVKSAVVLYSVIGSLLLIGILLSL